MRSSSMRKAIRWSSSIWMSGEIKQKIAVGQSPEGASLSPDGKTIAVCVEDDNEVTFVDVATQKVTRKIKTQGQNPEHCVFTRDEKWLITSNENSNDIDVIDLAAGKSIAKIATSGHPRGVALVPGQAHRVRRAGNDERRRCRRSGREKSSRLDRDRHAPGRCRSRARTANACSSPTAAMAPWSAIDVATNKIVATAKTSASVVEHGADAGWIEAVHRRRTQQRGERDRYRIVQDDQVDSRRRIAVGRVHPHAEINHALSDRFRSQLSGSSGATVPLLAHLATRQAQEFRLVTRCRSATCSAVFGRLDSPRRYRITIFLRR